MKLWNILAAFALSFLMSILISSNFVVNAESKVDVNCTYKEIKLYGKVQIVDDFADISVKRVDDFADLHVKQVEDFPHSCGKWQFVDNFADLKVKFVDDFEDIKVKMVDDFPGIP